MLELLPALAVLFLGSVGMIWVNARLAPWEVRLLLASLLVHLLACFTQIWVTYEVYGVGDIMTYQRIGAEIASAARQDPLGVLPQILWMLLQQEVHLNVYAGIGGESTQSMFALSAISHLLLADSLYAVALAFTFAAFYGKILLYIALRSQLEHKTHLRVLLACACVPSVIYWTAGLVKEAVALTGMGLAIHGALSLTGRRDRLAMIRVLLGSTLIGLIKPHLLFGLALAGGVWLYWSRSIGPRGLQIRPLYLILGTAAAFGGLVLLGELFPRFSLEAVGEEAARQQHYATRTNAGSAYQIGDPSGASLLGQLSWAPLALFTTLYRPFLFEARNPQMLINALETSALLLLTVRAVWSRGLGGVWATIHRRPILIFCLILTLGIGVMTGLASANLGTLSRYRVPMVPFFVVLVGVCSAPATSRNPLLLSSPLPSR